MTERVRSVKVHVEIDTNKDTYTLHLDDVELSDVQERVAEFVRGFAE